MSNENKVKTLSSNTLGITIKSVLKLYKNKNIIIIGI